MTHKENILKIEEFLETKLPLELRNAYSQHTNYFMLDTEAIQKVVDFSHPFLKTDKIIIFGSEINGSRSIGIGKVFPQDVLGHYNSTIYLALAGRLMPSTATIHLAYFFPETSPQAIEGVSIRMEKNAFNNGLIQPQEKGSTFYVETVVTKKKLNLVIVQTRIIFGQARFGLIENLRFVLAEKHSIYKATLIPEVI